MTRDAGPSPFPSRFALLVATLACWAGFAAIAVLVELNASEGFDLAGILTWRSSGVVPSALIVTVRDISALGGAVVRNLFAIAVVTGLLVAGLRRHAAFVFVAAAGGAALAAALKWLIARPRPEILEHLVEVGDTSFPSGHSFNAAATYFAIALVLGALARTGRARAALIAIAAILSLAVAWSRVWLGVHYPTDVIAGWLGGTGWVLLLGALASTRLSR